MSGQDNDVLSTAKVKSVIQDQRMSTYGEHGQEQ